ncbi:MAG: hypothetical protein NTW06_04565, partial [Candidatus Falkowbacteria bacterium]|nr:hypothetical protein [Candidatus Falkowbacteria bacterium]
MVNPTISKKTEQKLTVTEDARKLFQIIYRDQNKKVTISDETPKINVSVMVSKMAFYYEKIRNSVDYKEEYLLRKNAIQRILKRQIVIEGAMSMNPKDLDANEISQHLLIELIRAGYLSNNKIPENKISEIGGVIKKYLLLREYWHRAGKGNRSQHGKKGEEERRGLEKWIIAVAASEIEENLSANEVDKNVIEQMQRILSKNISLPAGSPFARDKQTQINVGIYRNFLKYDRDMLSYILFVDFLPEWADQPSDNYISAAAADIVSWRQKINFQIDHPLSAQFNRIIAPYTIFFTILVEVIAEDPRGIYDSLQRDPKAFPRQIKSVYNKRYAAHKSKLWRAAIRSIIYIFLTKS